MPTYKQPPGFDNKWRRQGEFLQKISRKHPADPLCAEAPEPIIEKTSIFTPADFQGVPFHHVVYARPALLVQSITTTLPFRYTLLHLEPTLGAALISGARPYKLFVTVNGTRMQPYPQTAPARPGETATMRFDARLIPGINRIEIECGTPNGKPAAALLGIDKQETLDIEKLTVFVHRMKQ